MLPAVPLSQLVRVAPTLAREKTTVSHSLLVTSLPTRAALHCPAPKVSTTMAPSVSFALPATSALVAQTATARSGRPTTRFRTRSTSRK